MIRRLVKRLLDIFKLSGLNPSYWADRLWSQFGSERRSQNEIECSRGQTPFDYLIGISLVLVTIVGAFALVQGVFDPFEPAVSPDKQSMADRLADDLITNHRYGGEERTLNWTGLETSLKDPDVLKSDAGVPEWDQVNVTIQNGTGARVSTAGDSFRRGAGGAATSTRTFATHDQVCVDGCRLIVRIWA